jgi:hypothetical protein
MLYHYLVYKKKFGEKFKVYFTYRTFEIARKHVRGSEKRRVRKGFDVLRCPTSGSEHWIMIDPNTEIVAVRTVLKRNWIKYFLDEPSSESYRSSSDASVIKAGKIL